MNWKYFLGACFVVSAGLLKAGAPLIAVLAGIGIAALSNLLRQKNQSRA